MLRIQPVYLSFLVIFLFSACNDSTIEKDQERQTRRRVQRDHQPSGELQGWLNWRGPLQNGVALDRNLPNTLQKTDIKWFRNLPGRGTPVITNQQMIAWGYEGEGAELREVILSLDPISGQKKWEHYISDYISDIIYNRYTIGSAAIDPESGKVYIMTSQGHFTCFDSSGQVKWEHSLMETFGRLTFPNGRSGAPVIDGNLVIARGITAFWGKEGPARDRFIAFNKHTGETVWSSTPGVRPRDSSFSTPVFAWWKGLRVFFAGTGCGNVVCVNAKTGEPLWRFQLSRGGVNASILFHGGDKVIAIHGKENLDSTQTGRMVALKIDQIDLSQKKKGQPIVLDKSYEIWRKPIAMFTSSPVLVGDRVFQVDHTGVLHSIDARSGETQWELKIGHSQLHASPLYADGKLYISIKDGRLLVIRPHSDRGEILSEFKLDGQCLGSPSIWAGLIYVHTTEKLYCFGKPAQAATYPQDQHIVKAGPAAQLQVIPSEILLTPNQTQNFKVNALDQQGNFVHSISKAQFEKFIPPTAKVKIKMDVELSDSQQIKALKDAQLSAGAFKVKDGTLMGLTKGRLLQGLPQTIDFESTQVNIPHKTESGVKFAYPPLPWIGARFKWEIRELEGNKVLAKTLDRLLFQRAMTFIGTEDMKGYTVEADIMTDGNRRMRSTAGVINQRYNISLVGNWQILEISSNHERVKVSVPFKWNPKIWYRLKTRVDLQPDGSGIVRAKAWKRSESEPEKWTIEYKHQHAHQQGSPGFFGFSPQNRKRVYLDNIKVYSNTL